MVSMVDLKRSLVLHLLVTSLLCGWVSGTSSSSFPSISCGVNNNDEVSCGNVGCTFSNGECTIPSTGGYSFTPSTAGSSSGIMEIRSPSGLFFGKEYSELSIQVDQETVDRTHIKIVPVGIDRWEVPEELLPRPGGSYTGRDALTYTNVSNNAEGSVEIVVRRTNDNVSKGEGDEYWVMKLNSQLVYQDQYLQFILDMPHNLAAVYGLGESSRLTQQLEVNTTYTIWNTDWASSKFNTTLYGSHPFHIQVLESGLSQGILFLNSNAMDVRLNVNSDGKKLLSFQSVGGVIDLYVFAGPTPEAVIQQYLSVIGKPAMMPYWSLGFHNCRWGYQNVDDILSIVDNYTLAGIPMDTQWMDIDYMDEYRDFTVDPINWSLEDMRRLMSSLHANNQHFVPIVDPGIYMKTDVEYGPLSRGLEQNVFVKDLYGQAEYVGHVWPGPTYFPDWFAMNATSYWYSELLSFYDLFEYDGLWIDMNEVSNFCNRGDGAGQVCILDPENSCETNECCLLCSTPDELNAFDFPPFVPHCVMGALGSKTIPMSVVHSGNIAEYNAHNLHGLMESIATRTALVDIRQERPFLLSRSTFIGSGVYTAHWTGDNDGTWGDLAVSIITINNLGLFGIPMAGADICGFFNTPTEELCARWIQVGAFSPFSRTHNINTSPPQELYRWDVVSEASRIALKLRYRLLPHLYTLFYLAHTTGTTVQNALWLYYSDDINTLSRDGQYMWSNSLLFTPVLQEGASSVVGYFPKGIWYAMFLNHMVDVRSQGTLVTLETPINITNVHLRGGVILPLQEAAMTSLEARKTPFSLILALDSHYTASGSLFIDNGTQIEISEFTFVNYIVESSVLTSAIRHDSSFTPETSEIDTISILVPETVSAASCDGIFRLTSSGANTTSGMKHANVFVYRDFFKAVFNVEKEVRIDDNFRFEWNCESLQ